MSYDRSMGKKGSGKVRGRAHPAGVRDRAQDPGRSAAMSLLAAVRHDLEERLRRDITGKETPREVENLVEEILDEERIE